MKRAALYVRVSTEEQKKHGYSVDNQIDSLQKYCDEQGYKIAGIYNDAGNTAAKSYTKRPALLNLIADCKAGKIDIILFTRLDRWFRNIKEYYKVQDQLEGSNVPWKTIWEDYETETSSGRFKVNIMLSIAQAEAERTSEKIKSVFQYKKEQGEIIGKVPFGYKKLDKKTVIKDPETKEHIEKVFEIFFATNSHKNCCDYLAYVGHKKNTTLMKKLLLNENYYTAKEPYITKEQHDYIVRYYSTKTRTPSKNRNSYVFGGLVFCPKCGKRLSNKCNKTSGHYYYCQNYTYLSNEDTKPCIPLVNQKKLEMWMLEYIEPIMEQANNEYEAVAGNDNTEEIKKMESRLNRLKVLFEEGDISIEEYKQKKSDINEKLMLLKAEKHEPIKMPDNWKDIYNDLDAEHKNAFWSAFIKKIVPRTDRTGYDIFFA